MAVNYSGRQFSVTIGVQDQSAQAIGSSTVTNIANLNMRLHEVSNERKAFKEELDYYEKEFNNIFLADGYKTLFNFSNLKNFVQLISDE